MRVSSVAVAILLFTAQIPIHSQCISTRCKERLEVASDWLLMLGVEYHEPIAEENRQSLRNQLQKWQGQKQDKLQGFSDYEQLEPKFPERLARVPSFKADFTRTPNYVYAVPEGSKVGTSPSIFPNPDHGLLSVGGSLDLSELFLNVSNRVAHCQNLIDSGALHSDRKEMNDLQWDDCRHADFLKATRHRDYFERYAAATQLNVTVSQIPQYQSGIILSTQAAAAQQRWTYTVTGGVSPAALFQSAAELKAVANYWASNKQYMDPKHVLPRECLDVKTNDLVQPIDSRCLTRLAVGPLRQRIALSVLPKVDVKAYTAFDYTKNGSAAFVQLPEGNKAIYDVVLTWDMRNLFPSTQMRSDAFAALKSIQTKTPSASADAPAKKSSETLTVWRQQVSCLFMELAKAPEEVTKDDPWSHFRQLVTTMPK